MGLPQFSESDIMDLANHSSYERGEEYADFGAVSNLVVDNNVYRAHVYGSNRYTVRVWDDDGDVETSCTCPYDWGGICKHIVAVMLTVLERGENSEPIADAKSVAPSSDDTETPSVNVDDLLPSLSDDQLRSFIRLQANEFPQLAENLRIFAQGAVETDRTVEDYTDEILTSLRDGYFRTSDDDEEYDYYDRRGWYDDDNEEDNDEYDTVSGILEPYRDTAQKYLDQGNWIESVKIHAAILHACGQRAQGDDDDDEIDEDDERYDYDDDDEVGDLCLREAREALQAWADIIAAERGDDKQRMLEQLVPDLARDAYEIGAKNWETAFQKAVCTASEAEVLLARLDDETHDDREFHTAGVMLHLLHLSGDTDRFVDVGTNAISDYPHLALPLGAKLIELGQRKEAIRVAEVALKQRQSGVYFGFEDGNIRGALLRFLIKTCTPETDYDKLVQHARSLLFDTQNLEDYTFLRDAMQTQDEREQLLKQVVSKCSAEAVNNILALEARWDDLLKYARRHTADPAFPKMIRKLRDHFPEDCFNLYRKVITRLLEAGANQSLYGTIAFHARQLKGIPGQEDNFGEFMAQIVANYSRRTSMMSKLGDLVQDAKEWQTRQRQAGWKQLTPERIKALNIKDLAPYCPIDFAQARAKAPRQADGQGSNASFIWAMLVKHNGAMDATDITSTIARAQKISLQSAAAKRSGGLRLLEALGHVKIDREGNRLRQVQLLTELPAK